MNIAYSRTAQSEAETLVAIRIAAMRESLDPVDRFDPKRGSGF